MLRWKNGSWRMAKAWRRSSAQGFTAGGHARVAAARVHQAEAYTSEPLGAKGCVTWCRSTLFEGAEKSHWAHRCVVQVCRDAGVFLEPSGRTDAAQLP